MKIAGEMLPGAQTPGRPPAGWRLVVDPNTGQPVDEGGLEVVFQPLEQFTADIERFTDDPLTNLIPIVAVR